MREVASEQAEKKMMMTLRNVQIFPAYEKKCLESESQFEGEGDVRSY